MLNIYLFQVSFWGAPIHTDITEFYNFLLQLKNQWSRSNAVDFLGFNFERNYCMTF